MTPDEVGPLTRPVDVVHMPARGTQAHVHATEEECRALARDFKLPAIRSLTGDFTLEKTAKGIQVRGTVRADITQTCVATLEDFDSTVEEDVDVDFAEPEGMPAAPPTDEHDFDPPDEIVNGKIDLGALTAEFLALGLDPYPRKPGAAFEGGDKDKEESPFAALAKLKGQGGD
ncbi:YceD family protein [Microvirga pudoricolor]|uniref:YceD family protein n=1 Tax=Microvirga pudoricolor TaxID=2778729 RepID=UPI00194FC9A9|nr:DUF177 domain-containing protein [Microvirga pudoricolor]MBM6595530.1 DUF177 domain-containing protein [Microvirga pudoricolor]